MFKYILVALSVSICIAIAVEECQHKGTTYKVDEKFSVPGECTEMRCMPDGSFFGKTCPAINPNPSMDCVHIPIDFSKPYPECCDSYECTPRKPIEITIQTK